MNDTNETYEDRCARVEAQAQADDETISDVNQLYDNLYDALRSVETWGDELDPQVLEAAAPLAGWLRQLLDLNDFGDDVPDPLSGAAVRIGWHFDALDAEQQDTIRRVLRQFPV